MLSISITNEVTISKFIPWTNDSLSSTHVGKLRVCIFEGSKSLNSSKVKAPLLIA